MHSGGDSVCRQCEARSGPSQLCVCLIAKPYSLVFLISRTWNNVCREPIATHFNASPGMPTATATARETPKTLSPCVRVSWFHANPAAAVAAPPVLYALLLQVEVDWPRGIPPAFPSNACSYTSISTVIATPTSNAMIRNWHLNDEEAHFQVVALFPTDLRRASHSSATLLRPTGIQIEGALCLCPGASVIVLHASATVPTLRDLGEQIG